MKKLIALLITAALFVSCTSAQRSKITGYGGNFKVEMYSGGQKVRELTSSGKVLSEEASDGYYFTESETGKLIEVAGDLVITKL